jgi:sarcosine oxidase subunit alpha
MKNANFRLKKGGHIDRNHPLHFTFNGQPYTGYKGDTLASALLANGVRLVGRSFKFHRPRGIMAAGPEETNAFVAIGSGAYLDTNRSTSQIELYEGLTAQSLNAWPSVNFDIGSTLNLLWRFLPAGFYNKTFIWPNWHVFEGIIRNAAGLGKPSPLPDPDRYAHAHAHTDLLVTGSGPAGLMAALAAAKRGLNVILAEQEAECGGTLRFEQAIIDGKPAALWAANIITELKSLPNVTLLNRTTITGYYDHNSLVALERLTDHLPQGERQNQVRQRLWKIEASRVVLATGAIERPMIFPDNDRPGIMLLSALKRYVLEFAVLPGRHFVAYVNHDSAYSDIAALAKAGATFSLVIDSRTDISPQAQALMAAHDIDIFKHACIRRVFGSKGLKAVEAITLNGRQKRRIPCDTLAMSGGWNPAVHLFSQSGGKVTYDENLACFIPGGSVQAEQSAGSAKGSFNLAACLADGLAAGDAPKGLPLPAVNQPDAIPYALQPFWAVPEALAGHQRQWIDFHNDVTTNDIALAARENFIAVEHLKRYTTLGMALDQGKTSNVGGLAIMGQLTGRSPDAVGTTTFRPPYTPVTFGAIAGIRKGRLFSPLRHLPTHDSLIKHGAVMRDYGGWLRPACFPKGDEVEPAGITREILAVRQGVGITDYSPLGKIEVKGPDAAAFLNLMLLTNIESLKIGHGRYSLTLNENGIVIDDGIITRLADDHFMVGTTSGGAARMAATLEEWLQGEWPHMKVCAANVTAAWGVILISGPKARDLATKLGSDIDFSAPAFPHMTFREGHLGQIPLRVHRVSFSGEISYELAVPSGYTNALWQRLITLGQDFNITAFGLESLLIMRLEKGFIHVGSDTDGTTIPDDIGYGAPARNKKVDFVGKRSLMRPEATRADRLQLVGLRALNDTEALPTGAHLVSSHIQSVPALTEGYVTSSALSPTLNKPVALGLLKAGRSRLGEAINVFHNGQWLKATVCAPTFYDAEGKNING